MYQEINAYSGIQPYQLSSLNLMNIIDSYNQMVRDLNYLKSEQEQTNMMLDNLAKKFGFYDRTGMNNSYSSRMSYNLDFVLCNIAEILGFNTLNELQNHINESVNKKSFSNDKFLEIDSFGNIIIDGKIEKSAEVIGAKILEIAEKYSDIFAKNTIEKQKQYLSENIDTIENL